MGRCNECHKGGKEKSTAKFGLTPVDGSDREEIHLCATHKNEMSTTELELYKIKNYKECKMEGCENDKHWRGEGFCGDCHKSKFGHPIQSNCSACRLEGKGTRASFAQTVFSSDISKATMQDRWCGEHMAADMVQTTRRRNTTKTLEKDHLPEGWKVEVHEPIFGPIKRDKWKAVEELFKDEWTIEYGNRIKKGVYPLGENIKERHQVCGYLDECFSRMEEKMTERPERMVCMTLWNDKKVLMAFQLLEAIPDGPAFPGNEGAQDHAVNDGLEEVLRTSGFQEFLRGFVRKQTGSQEGIQCPRFSLLVEVQDATRGGMNGLTRERLHGCEGSIEEMEELDSVAKQCIVAGVFMRDHAPKMIRRKRDVLLIVSGYRGNPKHHDNSNITNELCIRHSRGSDAAWNIILRLIAEPSRKRPQTSTQSCSSSTLCRKRPVGPKTTKVPGQDSSWTSLVAHHVCFDPLKDARFCIVESDSDVPVSPLLLERDC